LKKADLGKQSWEKKEFPKRIGRFSGPVRFVFAVEKPTKSPELELILAVCFTTPSALPIGAVSLPIGAVSEDFYQCWSSAHCK
jgi:hypothetical protein